MSSNQKTESIPLRRDPVDVGVLLELPTEVMQRQARKFGVKLTLRIEDAVPDVVSLDRDKVAWVITSLVGNALRHVRAPGGTITVDVSYDVAQSILSIAVRDDGPGIPPDLLKKLLIRGTWHDGGALALLLVEDIAVAHGGGIEIESKTDRLEHFTMIRVTIPVQA